jgi:hypothetical protein
MQGKLTVALVTIVSLAFLVSVYAVPATSAAVAIENAVPAFVPAGGAAAPATSPAPFAFVANFEDKKLDGFSSVSGAKPTIGSSVNYSGEPSLKSTASSGTQVDVASKGFVHGEDVLSFEVSIYAGSGSRGYFGLADSANTFVAVVGVQQGYVVAGSGLSDVHELEMVPTTSAQPAGWVNLVVDLEISTTHPSMQVFIDSTSTVAATEKVPNVANYAEAEIETEKGTVHYTNLFVSTYQMATYLPGYNNMEGYGQGSSLVVEKLPEFTTYTATMTLNSWSAPQNGILSFQINAMNKTGTDRSTCHGFFQLGLSIDKNGKITPWYVPGVNCESHNFVGAVATPPNSTLVLSITWETAAQTILFSIEDDSIGQTWSYALPYDYSGFYGAYTQMEFQPCCNSSSITNYALHGQLSDMTITTVGGTTELLPASYMLPFQLDAPPSWYLGYYQGATGGYAENSN